MYREKGKWNSNIITNYLLIRCIERIKKITKENTKMINAIAGYKSDLDDYGLTDDYNLLSSPP